MIGSLRGINLVEIVVTALMLLHVILLLKKRFKAISHAPKG